MHAKISIAPSEKPLYVGPSRLSLDAIEVARCEIGNGEEGRNNMGEHVERYRRGCRWRWMTERAIKGRGAWCAAFVAYCYAMAAGDDDLPFRTTVNAIKLAKSIGRAGEFMGPDVMPMVGDVAYFKRSGGGHIAFVSRIDQNLRVWYSLDGNKGPYPAKVDNGFKHVPGEAHLIGFARY